MKRCILLLVDGLRPDVAEAELAAGRLPHLAALTRDGGRARAITAFPSTTSVAYLPFLTGCLPGRCNVPSIRWMDRAAYGGDWWREREALRSYCGYQSARLDGDIAPDVATIFELVPESMALFTPVARGLTPGRDPSARARRLWGAVAHATEWHQPQDDRVARELLKAVGEPWRFIFAQFPAVDGYTHQSAPDGPKVLRALHRVDATVGALVGRLVERAELQDTLVVLVSDHGASAVHTHLDLAEWFRARGIPALSHPELWRRDPRVAVMVAGNGSAALYARPGVRRPGRLPLSALRTPAAFGSADDAIAALVREAAVAFVAGEDEAGGLRLACAEGEATVREHDGVVRYERGDGDPLALGTDRRMDRDDWLAAAAEDAYPDAPVQLLDQFRSPRAGDGVVIGREGYDFRRRFEVPEHMAGHGSLIGAHMRVPCWTNQPMPAAPLRTVDVFPAMLDWLGVPVPAGLCARRVWRPRGPRGAVPPSG